MKDSLKAEGPLIIPTIMVTVYVHAGGSLERALKAVQPPPSVLVQDCNLEALSDARKEQGRE